MDEDLIRSGGIGSSVMASGATAGNERDSGVRASVINAVQRIAVSESRLGIPVLFGRDVIHGHRTVYPIPLGLATAWTFAPMLDISEEPPARSRPAPSTSSAMAWWGAAETVMAAFTDVDGVPMHAHRRLLREVLKDEWGFDGVVVADWDGVGQLVSQGVATDLRDAAAQAISAGRVIRHGNLQDHPCAALLL